MIVRLLLLACILLVAAPAVASVTAGKLIDLGAITSRNAEPRRVTVWLPSSYRRDETLDRLIRRGEVRPTIVVGIWNTPRRLRD